MTRGSELELERRARDLVGQRLARVTYQQTTWGQGGWRVLGDAAVHSVGLAVFLQTTQGTHHHVRWADELGLRHGYGVSVGPVKVINKDQGAIQELTSDPLWAPLIGRPITATRIHWRDIFDSLRASLAIGVSVCADHLARRDYPQSLELTFEGGEQVWFSAARLSPDGRPIPFTNNLLVLLGAAAAARHPL